jgi:predicted lipoprotein with Yx(FWY)xxD motif
MKRTRTCLALLAFAVAAVLVVSACGGSSDSGATAPGGSGGTETVSVGSVDGVGDVLVDAQGAALYAADQETNGMVVCTGSCTSIWDPLTVSSGRPTAGDGVTGALGVVRRPDGARQVTVDGRLLYRFMEDPDKGVVTGNGFADSFDGRAFTWHVATPTGISTTSDNSTSSGDSPGSMYR